MSARLSNALPIPRGLLRPLRGSASPRATRRLRRGRISPAPRGECESSPQSRLNCALPLGAGALGRASAFLQRLPLGLPTPPSRARCIVCSSTVPCLSSRSAGRSPFKVCPSAVDVCFAFPTDFPRGRGRRGRRSRPKPSAAFRCQTSLPRICRARFYASDGRRPLNWDIAPAGRGGAVAPRWWWRGARRGRGCILECDL